jgi:DNA-binding MarR family transcriptional regulator
LTSSTNKSACTLSAQEQERRRLRDLAAQRTIELIYFAHIDQADWADHILAKYGIGRPHHRVLYFSNKKPGISVRELMALLRITNQALARTTNQLVGLGFLEQRYSLLDRRIRQNFVTNKGGALLAKLTRHQVDRVAAALESLDEEGISNMWHGLEALARVEDQPWVVERPDFSAVAAPVRGPVSNLRQLRPKSNSEG